VTRSAPLLLLLGALSCGGVGSLGPDAPRDAAPPPPHEGGVIIERPPPDRPPPPEALAQAGRAPLRLMTELELRNSLRDLLGEEIEPGELALPDWPGPSGFRDGAPFDQFAFPSLFEAMARITWRAAAHLPTFLPSGCLPLAAVGEDACALAIIKELGRRAFRRPVEAEELSALRALYAGRRAEGASFTDAARVLLTAMLLSPHFLYHREPIEATAPNRTAARLDTFSLAARLSYGLWATMPDAELADVADKGQLLDRATLERQARRLLQDPRALPVIQDFHRQWLAIEDLGQRDHGVPDFPVLARAMLAETDRFVARLFAGPGATLEQLLLSTETTIDAPLAGLYGLPPLAASPATVTLDPGRRAGVLTQPSFLATHANFDTSDPVKRGTVVVRRLLCIDIPDEPPDVPFPAPDPPPPGATTRQRYEAHGRSPCARACHDLIDQAGFAFEHYDAIGAFRTQDNGQPVDASGSLRLPDGETLTWRDGPSFARALLHSPEVPRCLTRQWFRYLLHRREATEDEPSVAQAQAQAVSAGHGFDLRELVLGLILTSSFTHRAFEPWEAAP
jgi:hypothetical protein